MVHAIGVARGAPGEADDVVQEVFLRVLRELNTLRNVDAFGAWLATIARNAAANTFRRARAVSAESVPEAGAPGVQHDAIEARAALDAIRRLPRAYRDTIAMRLVEGMTGPEIADRTGLSPASVRVNLHRGMKLLRRSLERGTEGVSNERRGHR